MITKKVRQYIGGLLACALAVTGIAACPSNQAEAATKAKLKVKNIRIQVKKKKTVRLKNKKKKAKYTFSSANKSIASVNKKGVIMAKKVGKTKITVKEKYKKKTRKVGTVKVTVIGKKPIISPPVKSPAVQQTAGTGTTPPAENPKMPGNTGPTATATVEPTATAQPTATAAPEKIDLSSYYAFSEVDNCMYDTNNNTFYAKDQSFFGFKLQQDVEADEVVYVKVKGTNKGASGFRSWLTDDKGSTCTPDDCLYLFTETGSKDFVVGDFEISYQLPANALCNYLFFKAASWDTKIEDLAITSIEVTYSGQKVTIKFDPNKEQLDDMVSHSLVSTGNNARIKNVIEKAKAGEDVTLAYIGGSITEGAGSTPNSKCYAQTSCQKFAEKFGTGDNVHFVNGGMGGTPSSLGIVRYDRDVLAEMESGKKPDILFVEFSVNDSGECTNGGAYEGLIRRGLKSGAAVILVFSVFRDNWNMQKEYIPYGTHYDLPMVSVKDAIADYYGEVGFSRWYFSDQYHPTNPGHLLMADCIMNLFDKIDAEEADVDNAEGELAKSPYKTDAYEGTNMMVPETIESLLGQSDSSLLSFDAGGFGETDHTTGTFLHDSKREKFPTNWMHKSNSGDGGFAAKVKCKNLLVVYKLSSSETTGTAELYVDNVKKCSMNGYNKDGWNNARTELAFNEKEISEHTIEIRMAEGNEKKEFTLLALGYN